jgi:phosphoribosyl 1,2-cyclic phosphodiesterase
VQALDACDALLLECNHDREMLDRSPYPAFLKRRIGGGLRPPGQRCQRRDPPAARQEPAQRVIGAHLSQQNNTPELARAAIESVLGTTFGDIGIACPEEGFSWLDV